MIRLQQFAQGVFAAIGLVGALGFLLGFWGPFEGLGWLLYIGLFGMWAAGSFKRP